MSENTPFLLIPRVKIQLKISPCNQPPEPVHADEEQYTTGTLTLNPCISVVNRCGCLPRGGFGGGSAGWEVTGAVKGELDIRRGHGGGCGTKTNRCHPSATRCVNKLETGSREGPWGGARDAPALAAALRNTHHE